MPTPAPHPELYILRHGQTEWNAIGRMQGSLDSPLTAKGRAQAETQRALMATQDLTGFSAYSSPQGRAFLTAGIALAGIVGRIETMDSLREIAVGDWTGAQIEALDLPEDTRRTVDGPLWVYDHAPGGEGFFALRQRCHDILNTLKGPSILVMHGMTSRMLRAVILGVPDEELESIAGGQGVIFHLKDNQQRMLGSAT